MNSLAFYEIVTLIIFLLLAVIGVYVLYLVIRALRKYLRDD